MNPEVWAPLPDTVALVTASGSTPMVADDDDWWRSEVELAPGDEYGFSLDGGPPLPDPRSRHQPHGVHGLSRIPGDDHRASDPWDGFELARSVLYEMHVGTFTPEGTFRAAIEKLDHLVELGVDAVSVMPVNQFSGVHGWGYDGVCLYAVHDPYGGPSGFRDFVSACHGRGLGVILDVVYNHLGPEGNYLGRFGPYFTDLYTTPWGEAVNLDGPGSHEVREFFIGNAFMWLDDYGVDGLRIDAVHALLDRSAIPFLEELSERVDDLEADLGRRLHLIAESDLNDPRLVWARERGGYQLEATWSDGFHHSLHAVLTGEQRGYYADYGTLGHVAKTLESVYVYDGRYSPFRDRLHGRPVEDVPGTRFLGYLQNHDQVGNRARGERISHLAGRGLVEAGATLVMTSPFIPMIFQGEEWAASTPFPYFSDHSDLELAEAVRRGRREEFASFGWEPDAMPDPQDPATFEAACLVWDEVDEDPHRDMVAWYRALIDLRHRTPELTDGRLDCVDVTVDDDAGTLLMRRGSIVVAVNISSESRRLATTPGHQLDLGPRSVAILQLVEGTGP